MATPKYTILVVDDDEAVRNLITTLLSTPGHRCVEAVSGRDGLEKAKQLRFDAVITDIVMPEMDGITLTKELVKRSPDLPIMVLTGFGDQYSPAAGVTAGAREFINKPFSVIEFTVRFHKMMREHEALSGKIAEKDEIILNLHKAFAGNIDVSELSEQSISEETAPAFLGISA